MKNRTPLLLISPSKVSGMAGVWAIDLNHELRFHEPRDYVDYWITAPTPEQFKPADPPPSGFEVGEDAHGVRRTRAFRGDESLDDPDPVAAVERMLQRKHFIYASNAFSSMEFPLFVSADPAAHTNRLRLRMRPNIHYLRDSPDVRLELKRRAELFAGFQARAVERIRKRSGKESPSKLDLPNPIVKLEQVALTTPIPVGVFLPVSFDTSNSTFDAVIRIESEITLDIVQVTLFCDCVVGDLQSGTKLIRHTYFEREGIMEEATEIVGTIA